MTVASKENVGGWTLVETMFVVVIIGLLATLGINSIRKSRETAQKNICIQNLRAIQTGKGLWMIMEKKERGSTPTAAELFGSSKYVGRSGAPTCPLNGVYSIGKVEDPPTCSIPGHSL